MMDDTSDPGDPVTVVFDEASPLGQETTQEPAADERFSTARSLLKFAGAWAGDDLEALLELVRRTRSRAEFSHWNCDIIRSSVGRRTQRRGPRRLPRPALVLSSV
jgi:hypothetical protein